MKIWEDIVDQLEKDLPNLGILKSLRSSKAILQKGVLTIFTNRLNIEILNSHQDYFFGLKQKISFKEHLPKNSTIDFVENNDNQFIFKTLKEFLNSNSKLITLWGNRGVGKTILLRKLAEKNNGMFLTSSTLRKEQNQSKNFFIIDQLEILRNRKNLNSLLSKYINSCDKKVILCLSSQNFELTGFYRDLKDLILFNSILYFQINNLENMREIINRFITKNLTDIYFSEESIDYLISLLGNDIKFILEKVSKIYFFAINKNISLITKETLKKIIEEFKFFNKSETINISNNQQLITICRVLKFKQSLIVSTNKSYKNVNNRNIVIFLLKKKFNFTHNQIAEIVKKDHSTISYSLKRIADKTNSNPSFDFYLNSLIKKVF